MKNWLVFATGVLLSIAVLADESLYSNQWVGALPPIHQDIRDVKDMVKALESNKDVPVSGLQSIRLDESVVYFRDDCRGVFLRNDSREHHQKGFVGPAAPLVLDHIECGAQNP